MAKQTLNGINTGLGKIYYSVIKENTYQTPVELGDLISFTVNPTENSVDLWAGDRQVVVDSSVAVEGSFVVPAVSNENLATLFGMERGEKDELIYSSKAVRPEVALLIRQNNYGGVCDDITLYRCRLTLAGLSGNTKTDSLTFGQKEFAFKVLLDEDGVYMSVSSSDEVNYSGEGFFTNLPQKPTPKPGV